MLKLLEKWNQEVALLLVFIPPNILIKSLLQGFSLEMGEMQGLDQKPSQNWSSHPVWNGTINPAVNYNQATSNEIYANYKTEYMEAGFQGIFTFSQLLFFKNQSNFDGYLLAGIGGMRYRTHIDAADAAGNIYDFTLLDQLDAETKAKRIANLNTLLDGDFETSIEKEAAYTPLYQFGAGLNWKIRDRISVSLMHRISVTGTDELDAYVSNESGDFNSKNDIIHFSNLSITYTLFKPAPPEREKVLMLFPIPTLPLIALSVPPRPEPLLPEIVILEREIPEPPVEEKVVLTKEETEVVRRAFDNLEFEIGKAVIRSVSFVSLNELSALLLDHPDWKLKITGHTDNQGRPEKNMELSRQRALAVRDYLFNRNIGKERFQVLWYGEERPIASNKYKEGRQKNRRVEMEIVE